MSTVYRILTLTWLRPAHSEWWAAAPVGNRPDQGARRLGWLSLPEHGECLCRDRLGDEMQAQGDVSLSLEAPTSRGRFRAQMRAAWPGEPSQLAYRPPRDGGTLSQ
jgi:hypothetical protein